MNRRVLTFFAFAAMALAMAGAKTYTVNLYEPAMLGATELKAGEYQVQLDGDKAVIRSGKSSAEAPVKVETAAAKFPATVVRMAESGGKQHITEIRLGGTTTRLVVSE
jgi:hypothetical protein